MPTAEDIWNTVSRLRAEEYLNSSAPEMSAAEHILSHKIASADPTLLRVAYHLDPENPLEVYESIGGRY